MKFFNVGMCIGSECLSFQFGVRQNLGGIVLDSLGNRLDATCFHFNLKFRFDLGDKRLFEIAFNLFFRNFGYLRRDRSQNMLLNWVLNGIVDFDLI